MEDGKVQAMTEITGMGITETIECEECDGTGQVECYACGSTMECAECDGTGRVEEG